MASGSPYDSEETNGLPAEMYHSPDCRKMVGYSDTKEEEEMRVIKIDKMMRVPIKAWVDWDSLEESAKQQALNLSNLPFVFKQVCLMPDCHSGYGMPIGGVLATKGVVIPNAVGLDIGCGMCAVRTPLQGEKYINNTKLLKEIMGKIRERIPVGFDHHKVAQDGKLMPKVEGYNGNEYPFSPDLVIAKDYPVIAREYKSALKQLGTLGGGNHFIEVQKDQDNFIWIMIHSGSRNLGKQVADYHNKIAKEMNEQWFSGVDKSVDLAFLPIETYQAKAYWREMEYCLEFAHANRVLMMERIIESFVEVYPDYDWEIAEHIRDIHHNYAAWENHFGENVIVHRKGATLARKDLIGIIPGSQGTASYIVKGLGSKESFESCSHGAGRLMGRKEACRTLDLAAEKKRLDDKGIIHSVRNQGDLEEAAGAYKDIDQVMENQKDLVEIVYKLEPLAVIKG